MDSTLGSPPQETVLISQTEFDEYRQLQQRCSRSSSQGTSFTSKTLRVDLPKFIHRQIQFKDWIEKYQDFASKFGFVKYLEQVGDIPVDRSIDDEELLLTRGDSHNGIGRVKNAL